MTEGEAGRAVRTEIDRQLLVHPTCLMFFCDDTGHEDFRDRKYPVFGIGGCAIMAGAIEPVLKQPWRAMKTQHFGGPDVALHASELRNPTQPQLDALNRFFREQEFCRFGVTITPACKLRAGVTRVPYCFAVIAQTLGGIDTSCPSYANGSRLHFRSIGTWRRLGAALFQRHSRHDRWGSGAHPSWHHAQVGGR
jgi:hypothetical protein